MRIDVVGKRKFYFIISGILFGLSAFMIFFWNLNLGIDMTGGTQSEFSYVSYEYNAAKIQEEAETIAQHRNIWENIINSVSSYKISWENMFIVEAGFNKNIDDKTLEEHKIFFRNELESNFKNLWNIELAKYTNIGASFGDYIKQTAKLTLLIAIVAIAMYIAYAFSGAAGWISSLSFAAITLVTLFHDVVISSGFYILVSGFFPQFQIDTFFITALLTILWYSINDTIVIFDRIRSNLKEFGWKTKDLKEIIEISISESITRSIYTSLTLAFVLLCIFLLGPDSISGFTLTMLFGTIIGTFSSIFIASPLLYEFHKESAISEYIKREDLSEEDKMFV
jgi:preprotein translocase subunit SecF